jgi:protein SDA1
VVLRIDWKEWEVGSEEDESDDSDGWIDVSSDEEHGIDISDSDDEEPKPPKVETNASALATSKVYLQKILLIQILTPADLAKLEELRAQALVDGPTRKPTKKAEKYFPQ